MKRPYLLDTNVLIDMANGADRFNDRIARAARVLVSPIVHGEFMAGIRNTVRSRARKRSYDIFLSLQNVVRVPLTDATADNYGKLWQFLSDTGRRIPSNDIWIAAHAMELGATLVTTDRHFDNIPNLDVLYAGPEEIPSTPNH